MNCVRHKTTELVEGVCPECGWTNETKTKTKTKTEPLIAYEVPKKKKETKK